MAITPSFTFSQNKLNPAIVVATDTSSGSYDTITQRRIYVSDNTGTYYKPTGVNTDYTPWPLADASISLDMIPKDLGVLVLVQWLNVSNVVVNELSETFPLPQYGKNFFYYLFQNQALKPKVQQDTNYKRTQADFWTDLVGGINAVEEGNDIAAAQAAFDRCNYKRQNERLFFGY